MYGLNWSPRHFFQLARKILLEFGLKQHPTSPCIFFDTLLPNQPLLYLGLYVNNISYFSESEKVEKEFETKFGVKIDTSFHGLVDHFLGISFTHHRDTNNNVTIHMGQHAFINNLLDMVNLAKPDTLAAPMPYRSRFLADKI